MKTRLQIVTACLILLMGACSEDPKPIPTEFSKVITGNTKKTWKMTAIQWTGDGKDPINYSLSSCFKDDLYTFYANEERLYEVDNSPTKCGDDEPAQLVSDSWSFINATATLNIIFPLLSDNVLPFYLKKVTSKEMTLEIYLDQDNIYSYKITMQSVSEE